MKNLLRLLGAGLLLALLALLAACATPERPVRATLYDFGLPAPAANAPAGQVPAPPLVLGEVETTAALDGSAMLYRLGYADGLQLRPYAQARWSAPPAQLVRQRLREQLGRERMVLDPGDAAGLARSGGQPLRVLRLDLDEFAHHFESPQRSTGVLRLRATLLESTAAGERLRDQRSFSVQRPAPSADAPGGARALAAAVDALADELAQWLAQGR